MSGGARKTEAHRKKEVEKMAIAKIEITCKKCGNTFTVRKECRNRREADGYEKWASENITDCPDCNRKERRAKMANVLAETLNECGFTLPDIKGVSSKQAEYAKDIRMEYLYNNLKKIKMVKTIEDTMKDPAAVETMRGLAEKQDMTLEVALEATMKAYQLETVQLMLHSDAAKEIIEAKS